jgi:hypothetical protein
VFLHRQTTDNKMGNIKMRQCAHGVTGSPDDTARAGVLAQNVSLMVHIKTVTERNDGDKDDLAM